MIHFEGIRELGKVLKDTTTLADGVTYDIGKIFAFIFTLAFLIFQGYDLCWLHNKFDPVNFGIGAGSMGALIGSFLAIKHKTEPGSAQDATSIKDQIVKALSPTKGDNSV